MSQELIAALGTVTASAISGFAAYKAAKAEKNSRPVSNGFAHQVTTDLRDIRRMLFDHLQDHNRER